jgi:CysZ protein
MAGFLLIPIVNLATPLFGIALMVHVHKAVAAKAARAVRGA